MLDALDRNIVRGIARKQHLVPSQVDAFEAGTHLTGGNYPYQILGYDPSNEQLILGLDVAGQTLRQSADGGATWSNDKTSPTNCNFWIKAVACNGVWFLLYRSSADSEIHVATATQASGNTAFTWTKRLDLTAGCNPYLMTPMNTDGTDVLVGEYGDPSGGPRIWRCRPATSLATWTAVWGPDAGVRHVHGVFPDPYNAGHWYASLGDLPSTANKLYLKSTDNGRSFSTFATTSFPQAVQLSFDENWIYGANDQSKGAGPFVMDRSADDYHFLTDESHHRMACPGSPYPFDNNAFYGAVDPDGSGYYYVSVSTAGPGFGANNESVGVFFVPKGSTRPWLLAVDAPSGGLSFKGAWKAERTYYADDVVQQGAYFYKCISEIAGNSSNLTPGGDTTHWQIANRNGGASFGEVMLINGRVYIGYHYRSLVPTERRVLA